MKHTTTMRMVGIVVLCLILTTKVGAICTLACNDQVQVSLDQFGVAVITPEMILDGEESSCPGNKLVDVMQPNGEMMGHTVTCDLVNESLYVKVLDIETGSYCWGTILIEDKLSPVLSCLADTSIVCSSHLTADSLGYPIIFDNCDNTPDTSYFDQINIDTCGSLHTASITRTFFVKDDSENMGEPCVQLIHLIRPVLSDVLFPPNFDNVEEVALSCLNADTSIFYTGRPMIDSLAMGSLCKIAFSYEDQVINGCGAAFSVLRNWTVVESCSGNILQHQQVIKIEDISAPVINCPATMSFNTNGPGCAGSFILPPLSVSDDCSGQLEIRTITPTGTIEGNGGLVFDLPMGMHSVTYEAMDHCGNTSHCVIDIDVLDGVAPTAICDEITQVSLTSNGQASIPATTFNDGSFDECCEVSFAARRMDEPNAPFLPEVLLSCEDIGDSTMILLQVSDCLANSNTCMVQVLTEDKLAPEIHCPLDITLSCSDWLLEPSSLSGEAVAIDNCEIDTLYYQDQENLNICHTGTVTRTFIAFDDAGFSNQCSQTITLIDTTPSSFVFPPDTLTDCSMPIDSISVGEIMVVSDCEAWALNVSDEVFPTNCGMKIFRTYNYREWCSGLDTSYTQFIEVRDTNPPVWDQAIGSQDTSYVCPGDLVKPPPPTATDFCTPATVTLESDVTVSMGCENRYVRTFTYSAVDTCGNIAEPYLINIFVNDTIPPSANVPTQYFACMDEIPVFHPDSIDAKDNCPSDVVVELVSEDSIVTLCEGVIDRVYRITDICGQVTELSQQFIWKDTIPPTAEPSVLGPFPCIELVPDPDPNSLTLSDNCSPNITATYIMDSTNVTGCAGLVWRSWQLMDECGNSALFTQILTVLDTVAPIMNCPDNLVVPLTTESCSASITITIDAVDNCNGTPVTITNSVNTGGNTVQSLFDLGISSVQFFAADACGNGDSCSVSVQVTEQVAPFSACELFEANIDADGFYVIDVDELITDSILIGVDFCTNVNFALDRDTLDCTDYEDHFVDSLGIAVVPYNLTVTDEFGNTSTCGEDILLLDSLDVCSDDGLVVGGLIFTEGNQAMPLVETRLVDGNNVSSVMTSQQGWYHFPSLPNGASCMVQPVKNDDIRNGVTTYDLIKISKHILGEETLASPYKIIAADANNSGAVTTFDVVLIRKVILHVANEFPNNSSWRFVKATYEFPDSSNPFSEPIPSEIWINNIAQDVYGQHFIGIKIGDVNDSASPAIDEITNDRNGAFLTLSTKEQELSEKEVIAVPIYLEENLTISALQATIDYDDQKMIFQGITAAGLDIKDTDYAQPRSGSVTLAWDTPEGRYLEANNVIFILHFELAEATLLSEALSINSLMTPAIAYSDGGNPLNVMWRIHEVSHTTEVDAANFFQLAQNRPNPFGSKTKILYYLKEKMAARLEVIDLAGHRFTLVDDLLEKGWHEVTINRHQLTGSGIYFYQLVTPYGADRRKMIIQ